MVGIREEQFYYLRSLETSSHFSDDEKLVLSLAVALTQSPSAVSDKLFSAVRRRFTETELVELNPVIAWENYRARFNRTFAIPSDGLSEGNICPIPEA